MARRCCSPGRVYRGQAPAEASGYISSHASPPPRRKPEVRQTRVLEMKTSSLVLLLDSSAGVGEAVIPPSPAARLRQAYCSGGVAASVSAAKAWHAPQAVRLDQPPSPSLRSAVALCGKKNNAKKYFSRDQREDCRQSQPLDGKPDSASDYRDRL